MANIAVQFPVYKPAMRIILAITNAPLASVTTSLDGTTPGNHGYISGTIVRLDFAPGYGMVQANQLTGTIVVTGLTTFTIDIDTTLFQPFAFPATFPENRQYSLVVPVGEINSILTAAVVNTLPY